MRVTFPLLGRTWVGIKHLLQEIGFEVVLPPPITRNTIALGAKYSPEFMCLPFKVMIGNYLEAIALGADAVFMLGGIGPCRLGYYAELQREILHGLGFEVTMIVLERDSFVKQIADAVKASGFKIRWGSLLPLIRFSLAKVSYADALEAQLWEQRYREKNLGATDAFFAEVIQAIDEAKTWQDLKGLRLSAAEELDKILLPEAEHPLRIGVVGEIYMQIEAAVNFNFGASLGRMGVSVTRNLFASDWVREHLLVGPRQRLAIKRRASLAEPYLAKPVGGHGFETVAFAVDYAQNRYDGIIQILPLTCMPEIIARSILPALSNDYGLPFLSLTIDEHAGEAGLVTRLEAFTDMLLQRRQVQKGDKTFAVGIGG